MRVIKKIAVLALRISISILLLIFLFQKVELKPFFGILRSADKQLLFIAAVLTFLSYSLCFFRWRMLLEGCGVRVPFVRLLSAFSGGAFFSLFLPSTLGGDVVRSIDLGAQMRDHKTVIATVLLDRLSGFAGVVIVAWVSLLFVFRLLRDPIVFFGIGLLSVVLIVILLVIFNPVAYRLVNDLLYREKAGRIRSSLVSIHDQMHLLRSRKLLLIQNVLFSVCVQVFSPVIAYIVAKSIGLDVSIFYFAIFSPLISAVSLLPFSIAGLGLRDYATVFFLAQVHIGTDEAFAISLLTFFMIVLCSAAGGIIYAFTVRYRRQ